MKIKCNICNEIYNYPYEQMLHRHKELELDGVPINFWDSIDYLQDIDFNQIKFNSNFIDLFPFKFENIISLSEGNTPLLKWNEIYLKDESKNPTGSFKDRGMLFLMNEVKSLNKSEVSIVSCGSAAISLIKYSNLYNIKSTVFVDVNVNDDIKNKLFNATNIYYSKNFIQSYEDYIDYCKNNKEVFNAFLANNISYIFGLRTLSYELIYQLQGKVPDIIILPCGSGSNVLAQVQVFLDMKKNGLINKIPKFGIVQIEGGNPLEKGFANKHKEKLFIIDNPVKSKTILSADTCFNYFKIYELMEKEIIFPISVSDQEIDDFIKENKDLTDNYDYSSNSVFAAYNKLKLNNELIVLIITSKRR